MARRADNAASNADVSRMLDAFEEAVDDLRIAYEKYFSGVDRQAPANKHRKVKAKMRQLEELRPRSTALRFRFSGLKARMVTYQHYWNRVLGQIEKGTFRRDIQKRVQRRQGAPSMAALRSEGPRPESDAAPMSAADGVDSGAVSGAPARPPPPPPPVPGMKTADVHRLFHTLVRAKQDAGENTQGMTLRALARKLSRELPKLRERHGNRVRFEVASIGGKVRLRARIDDES